MATVLIFLALLPALYGVLITGDFSQYVYKPSRRQVRWVLTNRRYLISAALLLWALGLAWHLSINPTKPVLLIVTAILLLLFLTAGFLMPGYILFRSLNQPEWITVAEANDQLDPDEPVIGLEINGDARAYPVDTILRPHMVHDVVGGEAVTMSYCMLCNSAMAFKPAVAGEKQQFITPLQWENNLMLYDASSQHLVQQLTGRIIGGADEGEALQAFPTRIMPWSAWRQLHPETKVLHHPPRQLFDKMARTMFRTQIHEPNQVQEAPIFPTIEHFDPRLPNKSKVLGVCVQDACKAYPVTYLQQHHVVNDDLHDTPLLIVYDPELDAGDVFYREHAGKTLTFQQEIGPGGDLLLRDEETGSHWNVTGLAIAGSLEGSQLRPTTHFSRVYWFSWANFYPQTEVAS
jgi:hypothetical protein